MIYRFTVKQTLPSLNEYLAAERINIGSRKGINTKGNKMKHDWQQLIIYAIRSQLKGVHITKPIMMRYCFYEPNRKRDLDNVLSVASKFIQDSMVLAGLIPDDSQKYIQYIEAVATVDKENPRIEVLIEEISCPAFEWLKTVLKRFMQ